MTVRMITKAPEEDTESLKILFQNIRLIEQHRETILKTPELYGINVEGTGITGMYIGHTHLYLGDLLKLWEKKLWQTGQRYFYHVGGSPLSGMSFCRYWDAKTGFGMVKNTPSFGTLAAPAWRMIKNLPEETREIELSMDKDRPPRSDLTVADLVRRLMN